MSKTGLTLVVKGSLAEVRPDIARDWDYEKNDLSPNTVSANHKGVVYWKCHKNPEHTWMDTVFQMCNGGSCPGCLAGSDRFVPKRLPKDSESFADLYPEAASEWNYLYNGEISPYMLTCGSPHRYWWHCDKHDVNWLASPYYRAHGRICPLCKKEANILEHTTPKDGESLADLHKDIAAEWDYEANDKRPEDYKPSSDAVVGFICSRHGLKFSTSIAARVGGVGCRECTKEKISAANSRPKPGNSLAETRPDLADEWDHELNGELTPYHVSRVSGRKVWWVCQTNKKHHYMATVANRVWENSSCPYCAGVLPFPGETDLATTHPWLAEEWDDDENELTPQDVTRGSHYRAHWICSVDPEHKWAAEVHSRTSNDAGCPTCGSKKVGDANARPEPGKSLADLHPDIASEWSDKNGPITPYDVKPKSGKKFFFTCCVEGHDDYEIAVYDRTLYGQGCPACGRERVGRANATPSNGNSLAEVRPDLVRDWDEEKNGKTAYEVCYGSGIPAYWICEKHGTYVMPPANRSIDNSRCPQCTKALRSSFPEKALYFFIRRLFPDAISNYKSPELNIGRFEFDIWIPSIETAAEYDGRYWHKDADRDLRKDSLCESNGIRMIRVREIGCPSYDSESEKVERSDVNTNFSLEEAIRKVLLALDANADTSDIDVKKYRSEIVELMEE